MFTYWLDDEAELRPLEPWNAAELLTCVDSARAHLATWTHLAHRVVDLPSARRLLQDYADRQARDGGRSSVLRACDLNETHKLLERLLCNHRNRRTVCWIAHHQNQERTLVRRTAEDHKDIHVFLYTAESADKAKFGDAVIKATEAIIADTTMVHDSEQWFRHGWADIQNQRAMTLDTTLGDWLRLKIHYLNGPAFGGLVGTARGFSLFLQDQLRKESVLLGRETRRLLETRQADSAGRPISMTLGWHIGELHDLEYLFKEGGGGGFHSEMRLYPARGIATVVMANSTEFNSTKFLNRVDRKFLGDN